MGLISSFRRMLARVTTPERNPGESRVALTPRTMAGVFISPDTALKNAAVWACVRYLSSAVGQLPWRVMREGRAGDAERLPSHPADWLLNKRPNPEMGSFTFRETMLGHALLRGNGYAEIERDLAGRVTALWPLHPDRVQPRRTADTGALFYRVNNGAGGVVDLPPEQVFHVRGFGDGIVGLSVVEFAAQSIGWSQATELFGAAFFGQGLNPSGIVETSTTLSPEAKRALEADLLRRHTGPRNAMRPVVMDAGMQWKSISIEPDKAQMVETMQFQVEQICRWFGVPPHKVMHLLRATFSNIEHQSIEVVQDSVVPWVLRFEEEADAKLFGGNRSGLYTKMNLNGLLRGDSQSRAAFYKAMREMGVLNADDIRQLEDLNPIGEAKGGRIYIVPANMTRLDRVGEPPASAANPRQPAHHPEPPAGDTLPSAAVLH